MTALTSPWLQFLREHGVAGDGDSPSPDAAKGDNFIAPLTHLGMIAASGDDAAHFLHAQLTNDIEHLPPDQARLAGYCSAKGRMLASMLAWRDGDAIMLQLPREILAPVQKRLQMYVLRSRVKLADASDSQVAVGVVGRDAGAKLATLLGVALPSAAYEKTAHGGHALIRVPDAAGIPRYQWLADAASAMQVWPQLSLAVPAAGSSQWRRTEIEAGIPVIVQATQEKFVPQMINFELVGGVNFRKGCYPGQEIVARSQYLGKLKRRMLPAEVDTVQAGPGTEIYASTDPDQPCGQIVNAEPAGAGRSLCLVELKTAVLQDGATLHLGSAGGPPLRMLPLPYPLTETD